jgi:maltooligosyltrehalose trehalohydrolase
MKRRHAMPFGAELVEGRARFRLWAPACARVELRHGEALRHSSSMRALDGGWHEAIVELPAGTPYAFLVDGDDPVPDPASRSNPWDVSGPSVLVDPHAFDWPDGDWHGRPWREAVVYELHVGTFTPEGTFSSATERLRDLAEVGVTAIEVMPLADFPGRRNWGYDGVLPFAPDAAYGAPDDFKRFIAAAHAHGLMVLLDVVYNHFGPRGNELRRYAPRFFDASRNTPWGPAINFDGDDAAPVRDFFLHNALYWLEEFHLDGLRLDAVHAIEDRSQRHIVTEIAEAAADGAGAARPIHIVLENGRNEARLLERRGRAHATAQWNDDWHHAAHVLLTGERDGYYAEFAREPARLLARSLAEGFVQGDASAHLPPEAFVNFLQNHDQVGNRAMGDRLPELADARALEALQAILLLAPQVPMLFMGDEYGERRPFLFFCDFEGELAETVREGRRREFAHFRQFADEAARRTIPDPNDAGTFAAAKLDWDARACGPGRAAFDATRKLLALRRERILPLLEAGRESASYRMLSERAFAADWSFANGARLHLAANVGAHAIEGADPPGALLHRTGPHDSGRLAPWAVVWALEA